MNITLPRATVQAALDCLVTPEHAGLRLVLRDLNKALAQPRKPVAPEQIDRIAYACSSPRSGVRVNAHQFADAVIAEYERINSGGQV